MAAHVNIADDFKEYMSRNEPSKPSFKDNITGMINGKRVSNWLYHPLRTDDNDDENVTSNNQRSSWLPSWSSNNTQSNSWIPSLSRTQRFIGFIFCLLMGITCFALASFYIPVLLFKARKFALLFTLGSLFIISSFSILWGPMSHLKHLFSKERLPFTLAYFGSLFTTLYFALKVQSTLLTSLFAIIQVIALLWYVISYLPGGQTGLLFVSKVVTNAATRSLPV